MVHSIADYNPSLREARAGCQSRNLVWGTEAVPQTFGRVMLLAYSPCLTQLPLL